MDKGMKYKFNRTTRKLAKEIDNWFIYIPKGKVLLLIKWAYLDGMKSILDKQEKILRKQKGLEK